MKIKVPANYARFQFIKAGEVFLSQGGVAFMRTPTCYAASVVAGEARHEYNAVDLTNGTFAKFENGSPVDFHPDATLHVGNKNNNAPVNAEAE